MEQAAGRGSCAIARGAWYREVPVVAQRRVAGGTGGTGAAVRAPRRCGLSRRLRVVADQCEAGLPNSSLIFVMADIALGQPT